MGDSPQWIFVHLLDMRQGILISMLNSIIILSEVLDLPERVLDLFNSPTFQDFFFLGCKSIYGTELLGLELRMVRN